MSTLSDQLPDSLKEPTIEQLKEEITRLQYQVWDKSDKAKEAECCRIITVLGLRWDDFEQAYCEASAKGDHAIFDRKLASALFERGLRWVNA